MTEDEIKEILSKKINVDKMSAVWFPEDWKREIEKRANQENMPIYKYLMMVSNNYQIIKNESQNLKEKEVPDLQW